MKRLFYSFAIILSGICLFSCESEDALEPDYKNPSDYFQPAADDNSEEAQLRRKFFADCRMCIWEKISMATRAISSRLST